MLAVVRVYAASLEVGRASEAQDWDHAYDLAKEMIEEMSVSVTEEIMDAIKEENYYFHDLGPESWAVQIIEVEGIGDGT